MKAEELAYYRAVEDHFALLRGTPFLFSPRDFALLRRWWTEGVPLAAVLVALTEVFERRRERGEDPVSSLSYCRHAVARHAKRLAAAQVGAGEGETPVDVPARLAVLAAAVRHSSQAFAGEEALARALARLAAAIETLPPAAPPAALDEALAQLEASALDALLAVLPAAMAAQVTSEVEAQLGELGLDEEALGRTRLALLRRAVREAVGLPRLEL
jgi:hypothetical protein